MTGGSGQFLLFKRPQPDRISGQPAVDFEVAPNLTQEKNP